MFYYRLFSADKSELIGQKKNKKFGKFGKKFKNKMKSPKQKKKDKKNALAENESESVVDSLVIEQSKVKSS